MTAWHAIAPAGRQASLVAVLALLGGCAGLEYGSKAYDPVQMPGTAEVAARTQYRDYHYLRSNSAYQDAVSARIAALSQAPMTEAAAVGLADLAAGAADAVAAAPVARAPVDGRVPGASAYA